jgi:hypothetical protein
MSKKKFRLMTAAGGDDRTESSLYDDFHVTCLRWAIGLEGAIVLFFLALPQKQSWNTLIE